MSRDWSCGEVLKAIFPLLDGDDLCTCAAVSRQWREIACDDYLWKRICSSIWPSVCKKPPPLLSYHKLFLTFSSPRQPKPLLPAKLSFKDLEFYFDLWSEEKLIFSEAIPGPAFQAGIKNTPPGVLGSLKAHINNDEFKMMVQVEPKFSIPRVLNITVSVLVRRKDTGKMARVINRSVVDYIDGSTCKALAYDYLSFSSEHPFVSGIRAWVSLLFVSLNDDSISDVFGVEIDFCDAAGSENEVLWLFDMLDWK